MERRELVRTDLVPAALRLPSVIHEVSDVLERFNLQSQQRAETKQILQEAVEYQPPLVKEVSKILQDVVIKLTVSGTPPNFVTTPEESQERKNEAIEKIIDDSRNKYSQIHSLLKDTPPTNPKAVDRKVAQTVHPDVDDPLIGKILPGEKRTELMLRSRRAAKNGDQAEARYIDFELTTNYYLTLTKELLEQGHSPEEIAQQYPYIVPQLERMNYFGRLLIELRRENKPEEVMSPFKARLEAARLKQKAEIGEQYFAFQIIHNMYTEITQLVGKANSSILSDEVSLKAVEKIILDCAALEYNRGFDALRGYKSLLRPHVADAVKSFASEFLNLASVLLTPGLSKEEYQAAFEKHLKSLERVKSSAVGYRYRLQEPEYQSPITYGNPSSRNDYSEEDFYNNNNNINIYKKDKNY